MNGAWEALRAWLDSPVALALALFVGSLVLAKLADVVVTRLLRQFTRRTRTDLDDRLIDALHAPIFWSVVLVGAYLAQAAVPPPPPFDFVATALLKTTGIVLWTGAGFRIASVVLALVARVSKRVAWLDNQTLPLFDNLAKLVILGIGSYFFLLAWRIDVSAWLASAGIVGIAVGLAAKDTIANLFGGMFVMADAPYKIGDFIVLDTGERGRVTQIGLRSTRILTRDDVEITIPNAIIANAKITNESGGPWPKERVRTTVGVAYGSDLDAVRAALREAAQAAEHLDHSQEPRVRFREFGDSALIFQVLCWVEEPVLRGRALDSLNEQIYRKLGAAGIQIPFPQRDVHLRTPPPDDAD